MKKWIMVLGVKIINVMKDIDRRKTLDIFSLVKKLDIKLDY